MTSPGITVFAGRFGSGKTEIALNYALQLSRQGHSPLLIDLDIVTPYFRTRDKKRELERLGVRIVAPHPAGQHIHVPAINPQLLGALEQREHPVVIDLGGDPQGARALSAFTHAIQHREHKMLFVVNPFRPFMDTVPGIASAIAEIETSARLSVSALVSNPNLMAESTVSVFQKGHTIISQASKSLDLPIAFAVVGKALYPRVVKLYPTLDLMPLKRFFLMFDSDATG
jgi:hypothetical protein